jgi:hypothetical protein
MDLPYLMLTGGRRLVKGAAHLDPGFGAPRFSRRRAAAAGVRRAASCSTARIALLFWLSWGLAVVDVPWWVRGLSFGSLCWYRLRCRASLG